MDRGLVKISFLLPLLGELNGECIQFLYYCYVQPGEGLDKIIW